MGYNFILCNLKSLLVIEIPKHSFCFVIFFVMQVFWFSMFWAWIFVLLQVSNLLCLDVVYHSRYFYIMYFECGDSDGYRCRDRSTQQKHPFTSHPFPLSINCNK
jgi:hypothetical protein